jgi:hypothetical protein
MISDVIRYIDRWGPKYPKKTIKVKKIDTKKKTNDSTYKRKDVYK